MDYSLNIKIELVRRGLEPKDLADLSGLSLGTIYSILRGGDVKVSNLRKIVSALGITMASLFLPQPNSKLIAALDGGPSTDEPAA